MKKLGLIFVFILLCAPLFAMQHIQGYCEQGGQVVTTYGMDSTTKVQRSYPQCTISVAVHGGGVATIASDNTGSPLANPFTADTTGHWDFYAKNGRYDITLSGAGISSPFTIWDLSAFDSQSQMLNVKDAPFYAQCDGVTDDTASINAAASTAYSLGETLFFPGGTCVVNGSSAISIPSIRIKGSGAYTSILKCKSNPLSGGAILVITSGSSAIIESMGFLGPDSNIGNKNIDGIDHAGTSGKLIVRDCYFKGLYMGPVALDGTEVFEVLDSEIDSCLTGIHAAMYSGRVRLQGNRIHGWGVSGSNQYHGIYIYCGAEAQVLDSQFWGQVSGGEGFGIQWYSASSHLSNVARVSRCYFAQSTGNGIVTHLFSPTWIDDCVFECDIASPTHFFNKAPVIYFGNDVYVSNCRFSTGGLGTAGVDLFPEGGTNYQRVTLRDCSFERTQGIVVDLIQTGTQVVVDGGSIAMTPDLSFIIDPSIGGTLQRFTIRNLQTPNGTIGGLVPYIDRPNAAAMGDGGMLYDTTIHRPIVSETIAGVGVWLGLYGGFQGKGTWTGSTVAVGLAGAVSQDVTVTGAAVGDVAYANIDTIGASNSSKFIVSAIVEQANIVTVTIINITAAPVAVASGNVFVLDWRQPSTP